MNPFTQIMQDVRATILYRDVAPNKITVATAFGSTTAYAIPIAITLCIFGIGVYVFKREEPWFAERA
jgi:ABC-type polysaccharide/polyol phosphate export permease